MGKGGHRLGSGRHAKYRKTAYLRSVDVRRLQREKLLAAGKSFTWGWKDENDCVLAQIRLNVINGYLQFSYQLATDNRDVKQRVEVTTTKCNYGGERVWFVCPCCARRCALVYLSDQVACRKCQRLNYPSQSDDIPSATWRKQLKLESRLRDARLRLRPKGMHNRTYERILDELRALEALRARWLIGVLQR